MLLNVTVQLALNHELIRRPTERLLALRKTEPAHFNATLFFVLLEVGTEFMSMRDIGRSLLNHDAWVRADVRGTGGRGGIRTHGTLAGTPVFKTGALNHSATLPNHCYH